ncbi:MAG: FHA domain-containing protein [Planctomycetota bacterium]
MLRLRIVHPPEADQVFELDGSRTEVLGRVAPRITLPDARVSRRHAEVRFEHGVWTIADAGSCNGTYVNDVRIAQLTQIEPGDRIRMGRYELRVLEPAGAPAPAVSPHDTPVSGQTLVEADRPSSATTGLLSDAPTLPDRGEAPSPSGGRSSSKGTVFGAPSPNDLTGDASPEDATEEGRALRLRDLAQQLREEAEAAEAAAQRLSEVSADAPVPSPEPPSRVPQPSPNMARSIVARPEDQSWDEQERKRGGRRARPNRPDAQTALAASSEHVEVLHTEAQDREATRTPGRRRAGRVRRTAGLAMLGVLVLGGGALVLTTPPDVLGSRAESAWSSIVGEYQRIRGWDATSSADVRTRRLPGESTATDRASRNAPINTGPPADSLFTGGAWLGDFAMTSPSASVIDRPTSDGDGAGAADAVPRGAETSAILENDTPEALGSEADRTAGPAANPDVDTDLQQAALAALTPTEPNGAVPNNRDALRGAAPSPAALALGGLSGSTAPSPDPLPPADLTGQASSVLASDTATSAGTPALGAAPPTSRLRLTREELLPDTAPPAAVAAGPERRVVFLVDSSGSTIDSEAKQRVWVSNAVRSLAANERFAVVFFYDDQTIQRDGGGLAWPTASVKKRVADWLAAPGAEVRARGKSQVPAGFEAALAYEPNEIVLLSDNSFGRTRARGGDADAVRQQVRDLLAGRGVKLHTVQFFYQDPAHLLETLAADHGGTFEFWAEDRGVASDDADGAEGVDLLRVLGG